ncbi:hypothetical protein CP533_5866 [Ophiocordyceps camponoti-saundersi (nom. inval.)]|nr:hypothetical protein CP533_5866 [Ophiocordyceps camponoti-saundersi (nom. inval.)]
MSAIAIQFDPAFTMGPRSAFSWPGPLEPYPSAGGSGSFGAEYNSNNSNAPSNANRIVSSESSLTPPSENRSLASSPSRLPPWTTTAGQIELKRQSDRARRDLKLSARIQRSSSDSFSSPSSVALGDVVAGGGMSSLAGYATASAANSATTTAGVLASSLSGPSFLSPYASGLADQSQQGGGQVFNPSPYHHSSMQPPPSYGVPLEYPTAYGGPAAATAATSEYRTPSGMPLSHHEGGIMYPMHHTSPPPISSSSTTTMEDNGGSQVRVVQSRPKPRCWEHGCNGRQFSTFSNLLRHQREKSGQAAKATCPNCGAEFTRTTARNGHLLHEKCKQRRNT